MSDKTVADSLLKEAYSKYYSDVYRFCLSLLKNDIDAVEDCVQEAYIILYEKYRNGVEIEFVKAFLFKTAKNFVLKRMREIEKSQNHIDIDEVKDVVGFSDDLDDKLSFEEYNRQISAALSDRDAEFYKLRYIYKYSLEEIANSLNLSVSVVGTRIFRLKKRLITILEEMNFFI